jgi:hypothetical protein
MATRTKQMSEMSERNVERRSLKEAMLVSESGLGP